MKEGPPPPDGASPNDSTVLPAEAKPTGDLPGVTARLGTAELLAEDAAHVQREHRAEAAIVSANAAKMASRARDPLREALNCGHKDAPFPRRAQA